MWDSTRKLTVKMPWSQKLTHAEVTELFVRPGDKVDIDDRVLGLSTSSGRQNVHAAHRGRVVPLVATGDRVEQGEPLYIIRVQEPAPSVGTTAHRFGAEGNPAPEPLPPKADWLDLFHALREWAWFMLACGVYVLAARFIVPYLPVWFAGNSPVDWLMAALALCLVGAGVFIALSLRGAVLARRFTLALSVCWAFVVIGGIEVKTGFASALVAPEVAQNSLATLGEAVTGPGTVQAALSDPPPPRRAETGQQAPAIRDRAPSIIAEVHPPLSVTPRPERSTPPDPVETSAQPVRPVPKAPRRPSLPQAIAATSEPAPETREAAGNDALLVPYPVARPQPVARASMAAVAPARARMAAAAPLLLAYNAPALPASMIDTESPSAPLFLPRATPVEARSDPSGITPVKARLALPARPEQAAMPPRRALVAAPSTAAQGDAQNGAQDDVQSGAQNGAQSGAQSGTQNGTPAEITQSTPPRKPEGPVALAALSDRITPLPWIRPRYTELSLLFQYLEDPRNPTAPEVGSTYPVDLPPEIAMAVTAQKVAALRPVLHVAGWCIAADDRSGLKRITTDPDLYRRFAVSDRMQLMLVELTIESDTVAMLADALPIFGDGDPGFFHNRRPMMGGPSGPELLELAEDWLSARSNKRMDPNYPDVETGGSYYFETEQLLASLEAQGCTDPVWHGGTPSTPLGAALDVALAP